MIKHLLFLIVVTSLLSSVVLAEVSLDKTLTDVDDYYSIVFGENTIGGDTFVGTGLTLAFQKYNYADVDGVLEGEVSGDVAQIFIGTPCNSYLEAVLGYSCAEWPFEEGQGVAIVQNGNVYITGTTSEDRRRVGLVLSSYPDIPELALYSFIIVQGTTLELDQLTIIPGKAEDEFVCGDGICEPGEAFLCYPDCNKQSCFQICQEEGYPSATCDVVSSNTNIGLCVDGKNMGLQYCAAGNVCCCEEQDASSNEPPPSMDPASIEQSNDPDAGSARAVVVVAIVLLTLLVVIIFIFVRG